MKKNDHANENDPQTTQTTSAPEPHLVAELLYASRECACALVKAEHARMAQGALLVSHVVAEVRADHNLSDCEVVVRATQAMLKDQETFFQNHGISPVVFDEADRASVRLHSVLERALAWLETNTKNAA